jgi:hypothetical protein
MLKETLFSCLLPLLIKGGAPKVKRLTLEGKKVFANGLQLESLNILRRFLRMVPPAIE